MTRVRRIIDGAEFQTLADISVEAVQTPYGKRIATAERYRENRIAHGLRRLNLARSS